MGKTVTGIRHLLDAKPLGYLLQESNDYSSNYVLGFSALPMFSARAMWFPVPGSADRVDIDSSHNILKIRLHDGLKWSDGTKIHGADYLNAIKKVASYRNGLSLLLRSIRNFPRYWKDSESVNEVGWAAQGNELTIETTLSPSLLLKILAKINFSPLHGSDGHLTAGPYKLQERSDIQIILVKNEEYLSARTIKDGLESIQFLITDSRYKDIELFEKGATDVTCPTLFPYELISKCAGRKDFFMENTNILMHISFNESKKMDLRFRKALLHLIDRGELARRLYNAPTPAFDLSINREKPMSEGKVDPLFDTHKGRTLLDSYTKGRSNDKFVLLYDDFYPNLEVANMVKEQLAEYGVQVEVLLDDYYDPLKIDYDMKITLSDIPFLDDMARYYSLSLSPVFNAEENLKKDFREIFAGYFQNSDPTKKERELSRIRQLFWDLPPVVPLLHINSYFFMSARAAAARSCF